jgi:hypothetical protein
MAEVRRLMAGEDYAGALETFEDSGDTEDDVLASLERGLLLHYFGRYRESNQVFEQAEIMSEDLYTRSISREAASLLTSDLVLDYVPPPFEQVLINYYRALNYINLGDREGALVECRKAGEKLVLYSEDDKRPYRRDAFMEYLTGMLYEWDGEINDAFIAYRNALDGYSVYAETFGVSPPPSLTCAALRTAEYMGFVEEIERLDRDARARCRSEEDADRLSRVVIFVEHGFVPPLKEWRVDIPILKSETRKARESPYVFSLGIASRIDGFVYDPDDVAYILSLALPAYPGDYPGVPTLPVFVDSISHRPVMLEDIYAVARAELKHDMPKIAAKTLARALVKYAVTDKAKDDWGVVLGTLVDAATSATERADLRAWLSLPRAIEAAVVYVEPGEHWISLGAAGPRLAAPGGRSPEVVEISAVEGSTEFVRFRVY